MLSFHYVAPINSELWPGNILLHVNRPPLLPRNEAEDVFVVLNLHILFSLRSIWALRLYNCATRVSSSKNVPLLHDFSATPSPTPPANYPGVLVFIMP